MLRDKLLNREETWGKEKIRSKHIDTLQKVIHVKFKNKSLLMKAMTHRSYVNESGKNVCDNERLEYLGDSVLGLVVNEYLYKHFEDYQEGMLAKIKSAVVSEASLSKIARKINLGSFILMGKGEEQSGGRDRASILANTLEAVIGALFLDSGLKMARIFVLDIIRDEIDAINNLTYLRDPKTTLQEYVQKKYKERPIYEVIAERGPDHKKEFTVKLIINGQEIVTGEGPSKRKAEMNAAKTSLKRIEEGDLEI